MAQRSAVGVALGLNEHRNYRGRMPEKSAPQKDRLLLVFRVSLWAKAAFALTEVVGGIAVFFATRQILVAVATWVTRDEFAEDPHDAVANFLLHSAETFSMGSRGFVAAYLLVHGVIKLWLIVGLLRERLWYYPVALVVFTLFIVYQLYRYAFTHSLWLLALTLVDLIVIGLTWHEWRALQRRA